MVSSQPWRPCHDVKPQLYALRAGSRREERAHRFARIRQIPVLRGAWNCFGVASIRIWLAIWWSRICVPRAPAQDRNCNHVPWPRDSSNTKAWGARRRSANVPRETSSARFGVRPAAVLAGTTLEPGTLLGYPHPSREAIGALLDKLDLDKLLPTRDDLNGGSKPELPQALLGPAARGHIRLCLWRL